MKSIRLPGMMFLSYPNSLKACLRSKDVCSASLEYTLTQTTWKTSGNPLYLVPLASFGFSWPSKSQTFFGGAPESSLDYIWINIAWTKILPTTCSIHLCEICMENWRNGTFFVQSTDAGKSMVWRLLFLFLFHSSAATCESFRQGSDVFFSELILVFTNHFYSIQ